MSVKLAVKRAALPLVRKFVGTEYFLTGYMGAVHANTICLASYPRSGNTALRLAMLQAIRDKAVDVTQIDNVSVDLYQTPFSAIHRLLSGSPALLKWHAYPTSQLSRGKVIYVYRDPVSVCRSYYVYLAKRHNRINAEPSAFIEAFIGEGIDSFGRWLDHFVVWKAYISSINGLLVNFDDLIGDPDAVFAGIVRYLSGATPLSGAMFAESLLRERSHKSSTGVDFFRTGKWAGDFDAVMPNYISEFNEMKIKAGMLP